MVKKSRQQPRPVQLNGAQPTPIPIPAPAPLRVLNKAERYALMDLSAKVQQADAALQALLQQRNEMLQEWGLELGPDYRIDPEGNLTLAG